MKVKTQSDRERKREKKTEIVIPVKFLRIKEMSSQLYNSSDYFLYSKSPFWVEKKQNFSPQNMPVWHTDYFTWLFLRNSKQAKL